jgi:hypothetical protein
LQLSFAQLWIVNFTGKDLKISWSILLWCKWTRAVDVRRSPPGFPFFQFLLILWTWVWIETAQKTVQEPIVGVRLELNICANQVHWTSTPPGSDQADLNVFLHCCLCVKLLRFFIFHNPRMLRAVTEQSTER